MVCFGCQGPQSFGQVGMLLRQAFGGGQAMSGGGGAQAGLFGFLRHRFRGADFNVNALDSGINTLELRHQCRGNHAQAGGRQIVGRV